MGSSKAAAVILGGLGILAAGVLGGVAFMMLRDNATPMARGIATGEAAAEPAPRLVYEAIPIGDPIVGHPMIAHVAMADLDADGLPDVLACDGYTNSVRWIRQFPRGVYTERQLGETIQGPVHVSPCDIDGDGDSDLLVASMGMILPSNDKIGSVVVLENLGGLNFRNRVLVENIARVTDVRGADFNGDGRMDLVVGQFGYNEGEIRWMENLGDWQFRSQQLLNAPGAIHTPVADYDLDGRPDFAALVSQDDEEVQLYHNAGGGRLQGSILWKAPDIGWGTSGLEVADVNRDGWPDLILTNGDGFDGQVGLPEAHGLQWLENRRGRLVYHRIGPSPGCYAPVCTDLDGDGDNDIVTVSGFNNWQDPKAVSVTAWLNDGTHGFTPTVLARSPIQLITAAAGDLDGNGVPVLVTGGFHTYPPWTKMSRVTLWRKRP